MSFIWLDSPMKTGHRTCLLAHNARVGKKGEEEQSAKETQLERAVHFPYQLLELLLFVQRRNDAGRGLGALGELPSVFSSLGNSFPF